MGCTGSKAQAADARCRCAPGTNPAPAREGALTNDEKLYLQPFVKILMFGTPGSGKSTFWNLYIGFATFLCGSPDAADTRLTSKVSWRKKDGEIIIDLPGLCSADRKHGAEVAEDYTDCLKIGGRVKLFFMLSYADDRIQSEGLLTMWLVLRALGDMATNFAIIINKVDKPWYKKEKSDRKAAHAAQKFKVDMIARLQEYFNRPLICENVYVIPTVTQVKETCQVVTSASLGAQMPLKMSEGLLDFVRSVPAIEIDPARVRNIKIYERPDPHTGGLDEMSPEQLEEAAKSVLERLNRYKKYIEEKLLVRECKNFLEERKEALKQQIASAEQALEVAKKAKSAAGTCGKKVQGSFMMLAEATRVAVEEHPYKAAFAGLALAVIFW